MGRTPGLIGKSHLATKLARPVFDITINHVINALKTESTWVWLDRSDPTHSRRWSVFGWEPESVMDFSKIDTNLSPWEAAAQWLHDQPIVETPSGFLAASLGYIGYDAAFWLPDFRHIRPANCPHPFPPIWMAHFRYWLIQDHHENAWWGVGPQDVWKHWQNANTIPPRIPTLNAHSDMTRSEYCHTVNAVHDWIRKGDCYQLNLSYALTAPFAYHPLDLYLQYRNQNPAPYSAFIHTPNFSIGMASPELAVSIQASGKISTGPIKGTRARHPDPTIDRNHQYALVNSLKEQAELRMIVDLMRNDMRKVSVPGTISVPCAGELQTFAHVHHMVATIESQLDPNWQQPQSTCPTSLIWKIAALFPFGSITGAPKIRAMEIIESLEPNPRGVYTGVLGWFGPTCELGMVIRTFFYQDNIVRFHVGAGIVADSIPDREYDETIEKYQGFIPQ